MAKSSKPRTSAPKKAQQTKPAGGRPKGAKTEQREQAIAELSRCRRCQSTDREAYTGQPFTQRLSGTRDGKPYNRVVRRRTRCRNCGQARFDLTYELVSDSIAPSDARDG